MESPGSVESRLAEVLAIRVGRRSLRELDERGGDGGSERQAAAQERALLATQAADARGQAERGGERSGERGRRPRGFGQASPATKGRR